MATITSPFTAAGQIGNLIFSNRNGKTIAYQKPSFCIKKWRKSETTKWARVSAQNFGGAAKSGSAIYKALSIGFAKGVFRPYSHNYIAKKLRENVYRDSPAATHYDLPTAVRALRSLDISPQESQSRHIQFKNIGPTHSPDYTTITGLKAAAYEIDPTGSQDLEIRISRRTLRFPEVKYDAQTWEWKRTNPAQIRQHQEDLKSDWFHVDHLPTEGLRLNLETQKSEPNEASLVFFIIEWRMPRAQSLEPKYQYKHLKKQTITKLATIRLTKEEAKAIAKAPIPHKRLTSSQTGLASLPAPDLKTALKTLLASKDPRGVPLEADQAQASDA